MPLSPDHAGRTSSGEAAESYNSDSSFRSQPQRQADTNHYEQQYDAHFTYQAVNQGASGSTYSEQADAYQRQQRGTEQVTTHSQHGMIYGRHYGPPNQGQNGQRWAPQQAAADYSCVTSQPASMSGQYPRSSQWGPPAGQAQPGYYPAPHPSMVAPPQHAHMASQGPGPWSGVAKAPGAPGSPLFSLQMLVNPDVKGSGAYRVAHQQESVDLSARIGQQSPIPLTRADKQQEHSSLRNGNIISSTVGNVNVTSPPTPLNGEVSPDSGVGSSAAPTPSLLPDTSTASLPPAKVPSPDGTKETVSVIAQTPPKLVSTSLAAATSTTSPTQDTQADSTLAVERNDPVIQTPGSESMTVSPVDTARPLDEPLPLFVPSPTAKELPTPVRSPKSLNLKRSKKVDSILENLVESGSVKMAVGEQQGTVTVAPSVVVVAPASVIVSPVTASDDRNSPSPPHKAAPQQSPSAVREDDVVSPAFSSDDPDSGKPRRKRKLDKPVRVSKTSSDAETERESPSEEGRQLPTTAEPVSARGMDPLSLDLRGLEVARRRSSSEGSAESSTPVSQAPRELEETCESEQAQTAEPVLAVGDAKPEVKNAFIEVESELEKMFAGIDEEDPLKLDAEPSSAMDDPSPAKALESSPQPDDKPVLGVGMKRGRPKGSRNGTRRSSDSIFGGVSSTETSPKKKKNKQKKRESDEFSGSSPQKKLKKTKVAGDVSRDSPLLKRKGLLADAASVCDSGSNASLARPRGPVIHVEGPRDSPYSVTVVNVRGDDDEAGDRGTKKKVSSHGDLDYRAGHGLFSSTLSARYDAHTTDHTWVCVFCKRGPHAGFMGVGDLFGPYPVRPEEPEGPDGAPDDRDVAEEQLRSSRHKRSLRGDNMADAFCQRMSRKAKRAPPDKPLLPTEAWVHEQCVLWAAGVHLVGPHLVGLDEAVWASERAHCNHCGIMGAGVGCVRRGCRTVLHVHCAQELSWDLDEQTFVARCPQHKKSRRSSDDILPT